MAEPTYVDEVIRGLFCSCCAIDLLGINIQGVPGGDQILYEERHGSTLTKDDLDASANVCPCSGFWAFPLFIVPLTHDTFNLYSCLCRRARSHNHKLTLREKYIACGSVGPKAKATASETFFLQRISDTVAFNKEAEKFKNKRGAKHSGGCSLFSTHLYIHLKIQDTHDAPWTQTDTYNVITISTQSERCPRRAVIVHAVERGAEVDVVEGAYSGKRQPCTHMFDVTSASNPTL